MPDVTGEMQVAGDLAGALQEFYAQMIGKIINRPSKGQGGEPLSNICFMQLEIPEPISPKDFSFPWDPAGGIASSEVRDDGKLDQPPPATAPAPDTAAAGGAAPTTDFRVAHAMQTARRTAVQFDTALQVTNDGTYVKVAKGSGQLSTAYEGIITKAQGVPAPPLPDDIQKRVDAAMHLLYVFDDQGKQKGKTKEYKNYQLLKQAYADAEAEFANAQALAMTNATLGQTWPVTSKSLRTKVQNAYDDWRSSGADQIENALDTIKSVGGSIGTHFLAQARELYDAWKLGFTQIAAATNPYVEVYPSTWWNPYDDENGFFHLKVSSSSRQSASQSRSSQMASRWLTQHRSSTSGGGGASIFGVVLGASGGSSSESQSGGNVQASSQSFNFSSSLSNVEIDFWYGLCTIHRPWLLRELFAIEGWYLPGEKENKVSDGTIEGQTGEKGEHLLPMIPTQFLVVRNVRITADGWGEAGRQMSEYCRRADESSEKSSFSMGGGIGFFPVFGAVMRHDEASMSASESESMTSSGSCYFHGNAQHGTLEVHGCQIVGYIGEIVPASPKVDGTRQAAAAAGATATTDGQASQPVSASASAQPSPATTNGNAGQPPAGQASPPPAGQASQPPAAASGQPAQP